MRTCPRCDNYVTKHFHNCIKYSCKVDGKTYNVFGDFPEVAAENLAKKLDKEILVQIGDVEYVAERRGQTFKAFVAFDNSGV